MLTSTTLLVHLVSFAAYLGAGFTQLQLLKLSARANTPFDVRDAYERLAATIVTKIEVPAIFASVVSGIVFIAQTPALMKQGWLHGKLTCVVLLLVLSHLEMFNARGIVKTRAAGGAGADDDVTHLKKRQAMLGGIGTLVVVALLILVTFVRLGAFRS